MTMVLDNNPAGFALNGIYAAIKSVYHIIGDVNKYIDEHIEKMKSSDNPTIARTGRVLEGAKHGFGIGYVVPILIISLGQLLLGNPWGAALNLGTAAILSNPIAMTCAAIGAIYYGWNALSEQEKVEIIDKLKKDIDVGVEFIKSIVHFVISKTNELLSSQNLKELKIYVSEVAHEFGKKLSDITGAVKDRILDAYYLTSDSATEMVDSTKVLLSDSLDKAKDLTIRANSKIRNNLKMKEKKTKIKSFKK